MKLFRVFTTCLLFLLTLNLFAQDKTSIDSIVPVVEPQKDVKLDTDNRYNLGFDFHTDPLVIIPKRAKYAIIEFAPRFAYMPNTYLQFGVGAAVRFVRTPLGVGGLNGMEHMVYGGRVFVKFKISKRTFVQGEYEMMSGFRDEATPDGIIPQRGLITSVLLGGTHRRKVSDNMYLTGTMLVNALRIGGGDTAYIYGSPLVLRIGMEYEW